MNKYIIIGWLCSVLCSCTQTTSNTDVYSVLVDVTDKHLAQPNEVEMIQLIDGSNREGKIVFRYSQITDVNLNTIEVLALPSRKTGLLSNAVMEKKEERAFQQSLAGVLKPRDSMAPTPHSAIFDPILRELYYLSRLPQRNHKTFIIYSDLRENNPWVSIYSDSDRWTLEHDPEKLVNRYMEKVVNITTVENISVHVIYHPIDNRDSNEFTYLQNLYTKVFAELDIPISFSANLTNAITSYE